MWSGTTPFFASWSNTRCMAILCSLDTRFWWSTNDLLDHMQCTTFRKPIFWSTTGSIPIAYAWYSRCAYQNYLHDVKTWQHREWQKSSLCAVDTPLVQPASWRKTPWDRPGGHTTIPAFQKHVSSCKCTHNASGLGEQCQVETVQLPSNSDRTRNIFI